MAGSRASLAVARDADALLDDLRTAVGQDAVITDALGLSEYLDPYSPLARGQDLFRAAAAVRPASTEEVQAVVRIAARHRRSVWPVSTGRNLAYGGPAPGTPNAVMLDMRRMNRVLEVSERFAYAVVEPGVSYFDLHKFVSTHYPQLWVDVPDLGWGSPTGNTAERGNGYLAAPYSDHFAAHCGMEVVLPDGSLLRTGMGALPRSTTWQLYQYGFGPYLDGLFSQSNFGIITKLGVWLMPRPARFRPYMFTFPREQDLDAVVEILRPLRLAGIVQNAATIRSLLLEAAGGATRDQYCPDGGPVPPGLYPQIMNDQQIGMWNLYGAQYGSQPVIDDWWAQIRAAFADIPGARWYLEEDRGPDSVLAHRARRMSGTPGLEDLQILDWAGPGGGHLNVSPVCPAAGPDALALHQMARDLCREHGQDILADVIVGGRELHTILMLVFDRDSAEAKRQTLELAVRLVEQAAARGWGVYRTHLALANQVAATYSWGDDALMRFVRSLKNAVDPAQVLAPGKNGI